MTAAFPIKATQRILAMAMACLVIALACACMMAPSTAHAVTAAEKQAEADAVYAQIDSLQTSLNEVMDAYNDAKAAYDEAIAQRDEAASKIEEATKRLETLQASMSDFAVGMYKQNGGTSLLDVILQSASFDEFLTYWDLMNSVSQRGSDLILETKETRETLEKAKATYEEQSKRAETEMATANEKMQQIEETQSALAKEAAKLDAEAAELAAQEELAAEAARQAEEARQQREEMISGGGYVLSGSGYFTHPCPGASVSSGFGYRTFDNSFHKGVDLAASEGTPYYAADSGTVMYATYDGGWNGGAGNWVVISHGNGIVTKYMHSSAVFVSPGQYVERGQNIGLVGNTGNSFGAHLHFQVEVDGVAVNPLNYI